MDKFSLEHIVIRWQQIGMDKFSSEHTQCCLLAANWIQVQQKYFKEIFKERKAQVTTLKWGGGEEEERMKL